MLKSKWLISENDKSFINLEYNGIGAFIVELTNRCNLRCKMCYASANDLSIKKISFFDFKNSIFPLIKKFNVKAVGLSGGEPTINKDFEKILIFLLENTNVFIPLYTNGVDVNDRILTILKENNERVNIRVSLDGYKESTNDNIRGKGSYRKINEFLKRCKDNHIINVDVVYTGLKENIDEFPDFYSYIENNFGYKAVFNIFLSSGRGTGLGEEFSILDSKYVKIINKMLSKYTKKTMERLISRVLGENTFGIYPCSLMSGNGLYITPNGDLMGCSSYMKSKVSNIYNNNVIVDLINYKRKVFSSVYEYEDCPMCEYRYICKGGCRVAAFQYSGNLLGKYPYCGLVKAMLSKIF